MVKHAQCTLDAMRHRHDEQIHIKRNVAIGLIGSISAGERVMEWGGGLFSCSGYDLMMIKISILGFFVFQVAFNLTVKIWFQNST